MREMQSQSTQQIEHNTPKYVEACVKKWEPLTKGIHEEVDEVKVKAVMTRASWVLEQEARYLNSLMTEDPGARVQIGTRLKFIFPVLRRALVKLPLGETEFIPICRHLEEAWETILEASYSGCRRGMEGTIEDVRHLIGPLGERVQMALQGLEKIPV